MNRRRFMRTVATAVFATALLGCRDTPSQSVLRTRVRKAYLPQWLVLKDSRSLSPLHLEDISVRQGQVLFDYGEMILSFPYDLSPADVLRANGGIANKVYMTLSRSIAEMLAALPINTSDPESYERVRDQLLAFQREEVRMYITPLHIQALRERMLSGPASSIGWNRKAGFEVKL